MANPLALITGANGWLGFGLAKALAQGLPDVPEFQEGSDRPIRCFVHQGSDAHRLREIQGNIELVEGDLTDIASLQRFVSNAEGATLFHAAGIIHPKRIKEFFAVNVDGTKNLLDVATAAEVRRFIHVSSNSPLGCNPTRTHVFDETSPYNPYMNYGKTKMLAEKLVMKAFNDHSIETVIIRPPWFYGPGQPTRQTLFFKMIKNGVVPLVGDGNNCRSMAYIDNICQGLLLAEKIDRANGNIYWIADQKPYTMLQIIKTIRKVLERDFNISVIDKCLRLPSFVSELAFGIDKLIQGLSFYHQKIHVLSEMNKNIACSIAKAEKELGYHPKIELEEGMRRSIKWMLDTGTML